MIFNIVIGVLIGWVLADLAFIHGTEPKGKITKNFIKFLHPINFKWIIWYGLSAIISVLLFAYTMNSFTGITNPFSGA